MTTNTTSNNFKSTNIPCGIEAFSALDKYVTKETKGIRSSHECNNAEAKKRDDRMDQSLRTTIKAFTARWLPLILNRAISETDGVEELTRKTWRAARTDMLKVINRVSYQSVLTLFLFSQTPIPTGISEEEEEEGISGLLCLHTALLQVQRLRERRSDCQFRGPNVVPWANITTGPGSTPSPGSNFAENYLELESRIYWAAVTWDTSSSLTYNLRASLTSGLKGACLEPVWILARAFLVGSFHPQTEIWRTKGFEVTDETSGKIFSAAAVGNMYILKTITSLKEALREGVAEDSLLHTWRAFLDAIDVYRASIRPLINTCERNLHYLDQGRRLCWFEVSLQYHLGVLTMTDALKVAQRLDLLAQIPQLSQETESDIFNVLKFGVDNAFTIKCVRKEASAEGSNRTAQTPCQMITITIIAIYPFISNVVDSVALAKKAIAFTYSRGEIKDDVYSYLNSILARTLVQLPQCSQRVILARKTYRDWEFPRL